MKLIKSLDTFNTGRQYTKQGQQIIIAILKDNRIAFNDTSRGINGITILSMPDNIIYWDSIVNYFMSQYDDNCYNNKLIEPLYIAEGFIAQEKVEIRIALNM